MQIFAEVRVIFLPKPERAVAKARSAEPARVGFVKKGGAHSRIQSFLMLPHKVTGRLTRRFMEDGLGGQVSNILGPRVTYLGR